jgi:two-component system chemotaxis sensor kinase CheA
MRVVLSGEDTRVPRAFVEKLGDPLVHMIRNAVDHGIESSEERRQSDKQLLATVKLTSHRHDNQVLIEVGDDGRGIDSEKVLARAIKKEIIDAETKLSEQEIYQLLFAPGFSTAEQVTSLSGRGVGMDVVKRNIESLGGRIEIQSSLGRGSTFQIMLPLR